MEGDDEIQMASSSLSRRKGGSSSLWRNLTAPDAFSRSQHPREEDDEEEALRWAAIEKLPTFRRLQRGLLSGSTGPSMEVDVTRFGDEERRKLMERLVKVADEDNEKFLQKLRDRMDRVGIDLATVQVRFEHLNVEAEAFVGTNALPTLTNFYFSIIEGALNYLRILPSRKKPLTILNDVSGIIKPSRMTLLLGPPSSGKTTLMLALAGKLDPDLKVSGRVTYNGHELNEFVPERTAAYVSQHDVHIGEMTVRETLAFSARCQGVGSRYEMLAELSRREVEANIRPDPDIDIFMKSAATEGQEATVVTDYILKMLGLDICADTMVGDEMLRGISGGQRKRVTTGEMLIGPTNVLFMDEISTGLDSSTTFRIVKSLRQIVHIMKETVFISLLQPAPETYDLFDDIVLLSDGLIIYQGPREHVLEFFESMGFKCPDRKGVADFLQEVTSKKDQEQYWADRDDPYRFITGKEFSDAFQSFHVGRDLLHELSTPFDKSKSHPAALVTKKYGVNKKEILKAVSARELLLIKRNSFVYIFKLSQIIMMAIIGMTVFFRTKLPREDVADGTVYLGALYYVIYQVMFNGFSEVSMTIHKLPVFFKQRDLRFFPAWSYALPSWILKIPITLVEIASWVFLTYYVIGFDPSPGRLFKQYLLLVVFNQMAASLFRFIGAAGRNLIVAYTVGSLALLLILIFNGFILSKEQIRDWLIWGFWCSPWMYAQSAIIVNEFTGNNWKHILPNSSEPLGVEVLKSRGLFTDPKWYWIGLAANVGFIILFNILFALSLTFLNPFEKTVAVIPEESENSEYSVQTKASLGEESRKKGMILPFEPHSITFDDIKYSVDMPQEMKVQGDEQDKLMLLKGVSGAFRPGVLTALMGVSGAGKTTLMDVLAGRKTGGYIQGNITISGYPKNQDTFARISGYCEQNDIHSPHVTVYESLVYSAWLRLPKEVDSKNRKMFVEEVMELVELAPLRDALVGLPGVNGLSTEQRKRLTIAVELVANPSIIFMDEPTSGLDARAAAIVIRTIRNTVDTGRTVVCTIHQPSIDIFEAFDELFLMKRGGEEIYVGPLGHNSSELIKYFEGVEGITKINEGYNPATWMLEVTAFSQEVVLGVDFSEVYRNSDLYARNKSLIRELNTPRPNTQDLHFPTKHSQSCLVQCMACLWKQRISYWRNPPYTAVRLLFTTITGLTFGAIFWDLGRKKDTQQDLLNAIGSMYAAIIFLGFQNLSAVQPVVSIERTVFYRERASGMYSALPYAFGQVAIEVPYVFVQSVSYASITYAMIGYDWTAKKFFWYLFFMYFSLLYFTFYGMMTIALTPNQNVSAIISVAFLAMWNLFSGFVIPRPRIPVWWRWNYWATPIAWTLYGMIVAQWGDVEDTFGSDQTTVKEFLRSNFGLRHEFLGAVAGVIVGLPVVFAFIFACSIKAFNFQKR